jgi:hypothetical protein
MDTIKFQVMSNVKIHSNYPTGDQITVDDDITSILRALIVPILLVSSTVERLVFAAIFASPQTAPG